MLILNQAKVEEWPKDRLCFLWKTVWNASQKSVNDTWFYVPQQKFDDFRMALTRPDVDSNLHWISEDPDLQEAVWLQYNFNHPTNNMKEPNEVYELTSRSVGDWRSDTNHGKFHQARLEQQVDSASKSYAESLTPSKRLDVWCSRVKELLDEQTDSLLHMPDFASLWSERWPHDAIVWYIPISGKLLKSVELCKEVTREGKDAVKWKFNRIYPLHSARTICANCYYRGDRRMFWECGSCKDVVCVMCGHASMKYDCEERFLCERCWAIPPWRRW